ncbi:hypothetical protein MRB53_027688 [Persea americana]|uniref:Uncharacterized protein n=1 Tax=Persea americana TaxID=3435 RepID=A0ACC2LMN5_PERAE|nr:hypothetical protein MRB53_027688 [Persea americana]
MAHFLVFSFPAYGSIHPTHELARRLARAGSRVTYVTSLSVHRRILSQSPAPPEGLSYASFSDGYDEGFTYNLDRDTESSTAKIIDDDELKSFLGQFTQSGAQKLPDLVRALKDEGRPVTCIIYGMLLTWVADLARDLQIPSIAVWIQPATALAVYYHYFNGYDHLIERLGQDQGFLLELPGLPPLAYHELPEYITSSVSSPEDNHMNMLSSFQLQMKEFKENPRLLVNSFDALEGDVFASVDGVRPITIGPLIPSNFFDGNGKWAMSTRSGDYMKWLDSKPASSVVYVSFGSMIVPTKRQMDEILNGLVESKRPFLWVIRVPGSGSDNGPGAEIRSRVGGTEHGLVVPWCSQLEVLAHPATGCFVTHCGWNSTSESLAMGVPMVCFPQWTDQTTTGKLVEDVWRTGVRVKANGDGIMEAGELKRCLEEVMGGEEIKKNAEKWRDLAREALGEGGSSDRNIKAFVEEMGGGSLS